MILRLHPSYLSKYLRSKHPIASQGKQLGRVLAERLANTALLYSDILLNPGFASSLANVLEMLHLILDMHTGYNQEPISADVKRTIVTFLKTSMKSQNQYLRANSETLSRFFVDQVRSERLARGRVGCGILGCHETCTLKACAG